MKREDRQSVDQPRSSNQGGRRMFRLALLGLAVSVGASLPGLAPVVAQSFKWPWENDEPAPRPRAPVYRDDARPAPPPTVQPGPGGVADGWTARSSVCLQLERRLVEENQRGGQARTQLPAIQEEMRQLDRAIRSGENDLDRRGCYEYFLFTKTLRQTRSCVRRARRVEQDQRRLAELEAQRQALSSSSNQSYQDEIIRELARNNCGGAYQQEARRRDRSPFSGFWDDGETDSSYGGNRYQSLPFATYRTLCVRLCDGYYFPVSFSTLPNHFQRDQDVCQSKCAAPAQLYYHQNPGGSIDQMLALNTNEPYTQLDSAFKYRKEYVRGCSCKQAEFVPQTQTPGGAPAAPVQEGRSPAPTDRRAEMPQTLSPRR